MIEEVFVHILFVCVEPGTQGLGDLILPNPGIINEGFASKGHYNKEKQHGLTHWIQGDFSKLT